MALLDWCYGKFIDRLHLAIRRLFYRFTDGLGAGRLGRRTAWSQDGLVAGRLGHRPAWAQGRGHFSIGTISCPTGRWLAQRASAPSLLTGVLTCAACLATACFWSGPAWPQSGLRHRPRIRSRQLVGTARFCFGAGHLLTMVLGRGPGNGLAERDSSTIATSLYLLPPGLFNPRVGQSNSFCQFLFVGEFLW